MTDFAFRTEPGTSTLRTARLLREPLFGAAAFVLALATLPTLAAFAVDDRLFLGIDIWVKPLKFEIALAIYLLTLSVYARWLPAATLGRRWYRVFAAAVVFAVTLEMVAIGGAAALGTASHFNTTPAGQVVYAFMGAFAVLLTSASLVYGLLIARSQLASLGSALRAGLVLGLVMTFALTLLTAGYMSQSGSHFIGGAMTDAAGMPLMGWARDGGDLRVAHFFATHAMHALPLAGWLLGRWLPARPAVGLTWAGAALYGTFCIFTFLQALAGQPFLPSWG